MTLPWKPGRISSADLPEPYSHHRTTTPTRLGQSPRPTTSGNCMAAIGRTHLLRTGLALVLLLSGLALSPVHAAQAGQPPADQNLTLGEASGAAQSEEGSALDRIFGSPSAGSTTPPAELPAGESSPMDDPETRQLVLDLPGEVDFLEDDPLAKNAPGGVPIPPVRTKPAPAGGTAEPKPGEPKAAETKSAQTNTAPKPPSGKPQETTGVKFENMPLHSVIDFWNELLKENYQLDVAKDGLDPKTAVTYSYEGFRPLSTEELREVFDDFCRNLTSDEGFKLAVERVRGVKSLRMAYEINTEKTSLPEILDQLAEYLQINYILDPKAATGRQVTIVTHKNVYLTRNQIWDVWYTLLQINGLFALEKGTYWQILPVTEAPKVPLDIKYPRGFIEDLNLVAAFNYLDQRSETDKLIMEVVPLRYADTQEVMNAIKPFMTANSQVFPQVATNTLIVVETQSNLKKLLKLVEILDVDTTSGEMAVFQIVYAQAKEISDVVQKILNSKARKMLQPAAAAGGAAGAGATPATRTRNTVTAGQASGSSGSSDAMIHADERSNSIIMFGLKRDIEFSRQIIQLLDQDIYSSTKTFLYFVENAKAEDLAKLLNSVYSKSGSSSTNQQSLSASPRAQAARQLAGTSGAAGQVSTSGGGGENEGTLSGEFNIVSDTRTNSLVIVASEADYRKILTLLKKLDIPPRQVLIEVLYAEITLDDNLKFGVDWTLLSQGKLNLGGDTYAFDSVTRQNFGQGTQGFSYSLVESTRFRAALQTFSGDNRLRVLSNPHLMASNNLEAKISIGDQVPIVRSQVSNTTNTINNNFDIRQDIEYRDTGIVLTITPSINENRFVTLELDQEISEVKEASAGSSTVTPTIQKRSINTTVMVQDAMSLVIGGLIRTVDSKTQTGIPGISKIPVFGYLFSNMQKRRQNVELLTVITPHVIISPQDATLAGDSIWDKSKAVTEFFNKNQERFY